MYGIFIPKISGGVIPPFLTSRLRSGVLDSTKDTQYFVYAVYHTQYPDDIPTLDVLEARLKGIFRWISSDMPGYMYTWSDPTTQPETYVPDFFKYLKTTAKLDSANQSLGGISQIQAGYLSGIQYFTEQQQAVIVQTAIVATQVEELEVQKEKVETDIPQVRKNLEQVKTRTDRIQVQLQDLERTAEKVAQTKKDRIEFLRMKEIYQSQVSKLMAYQREYQCELEAYCKKLEKCRHLKKELKCHRKKYGRVREEKKNKIEWIEKECQSWDHQFDLDQKFMKELEETIDEFEF